MRWQRDAANRACGTSTTRARPCLGRNEAPWTARQPSLVCYWHIADIDFDAANVCFLGQEDMTLGLSPCQLLTQSGPALTMRTARPTTGSPLCVSESGTAPFDPASSCFGFFRRLNPADPFIAREGPNVLPRLQRFCVGGQRLF